jgi:large subunit ribosomal protein L29
MARRMSEIKDLPTTELEDHLAETRAELFNLRFQLATGQLDNYRRVRLLGREVARLKTVLRERELAGEDTE